MNIEEIYQDALSGLEKAETLEEIENLSVKYLGRKGQVTVYLRGVSALPPEERPLAGKRANEVKVALEAAVADARAACEARAASADPGIDVTLPGRMAVQGRLHPLTQITQEICGIFTRLGFSIVEGPEIESDYYNFEALNIPKHHPARDMQDTFYISDNTVLRTHTSPTQPRVMEKQEPPVRIIAPGKVYRCDSDITHTPMFHQDRKSVV